VTASVALGEGHLLLLHASSPSS